MNSYVSIKIIFLLVADSMIESESVEASSSNTEENITSCEDVSNHKEVSLLYLLKIRLIIYTFQLEDLSHYDDINESETIESNSYSGNKKDLGHRTKERMVTF